MVGAPDWWVREIANIRFSLQGLNVYPTGTIIAEFWLERVCPREVRGAHRNGELYLHDLGVTRFWLGEQKPDPLACRAFIMQTFRLSCIPAVSHHHASKQVPGRPV